MHLLDPEFPNSPNAERAEELGTPLALAYSGFEPLVHLGVNSYALGEDLCFRNTFMRRALRCLFKQWQHVLLRQVLPAMTLMTLQRAIHNIRGTC